MLSFPVPGCFQVVPLPYRWEDKKRDGALLFLVFFCSFCSTSERRTKKNTHCVARRAMANREHLPGILCELFELCWKAPWFPPTALISCHPGEFNPCAKCWDCFLPSLAHALSSAFNSNKFDVNLVLLSPAVGIQSIASAP